MPSIKSVILNYGTPFTVGLFIVSAVSGVALYFHVGTTLFREMHEVLSMVLLVPVVVHLWRNWVSFVAYFKRAAMPVALVVSLLWAAFYAYGALNPAASTAAAGGNPVFALLGTVQETPLSALAPAMRIDGATAVKRLTDAGFAGVAEGDSVASIAARTKRDRLEIIAALTRGAR